MLQNETNNDLNLYDEALFIAPLSPQPENDPPPPDPIYEELPKTVQPVWKTFSPPAIPVDPDDQSFTTSGAEYMDMRGVSRASSVLQIHASDDVTEDKGGEIGGFRRSSSVYSDASNFEPHVEPIYDNVGPSRMAAPEVRDKKVVH